MKAIKIKEDVRVPGTDIILEAGDRINIFESDRMSPRVEKALRDVVELVAEDSNIKNFDGGSIASIAELGYEFARVIYKFGRESNSIFSNNFFIALRNFIK